MSDGELRRDTQTEFCIKQTSPEILHFPRITQMVPWCCELCLTRSDYRDFSWSSGPLHCIEDWWYQSVFILWCSALWQTGQTGQIVSKTGITPTTVLQLITTPPHPTAHWYQSLIYLTIPRRTKMWISAGTDNCLHSPQLMWGLLMNLSDLSGGLISFSISKPWD